MFSSDQMTLAPEAVLFAASVAFATTIASLVGSALAWMCRRHEAPVRHAIILTTVGVSVASPFLLVISSPYQTGWLRLPVPASLAQSTAIDSQIGLTLNRPSTEGKVQGGRSAADAAKEEVASFPKESAWSRIAASWQVIGTVLIVLWLLGVLIGIARAIRGILVLLRFLQTLEMLPHPRLVAAVGDAFRSVGSDRRARVFVTPVAFAPFSLGLLRPMIIVPAYLANDSAAERLRFVLTHEVAHVVRRDQWVAILQRVAGMLYWWNPLYRILNRRLSQAREEICDDYVLQAKGEGRRFAATLLDVAERTALIGLPAGTALLDDDAKALEQRIRRLVNPRPTPETRMGRGAVLATSLFCVLLSAIVLASRVQSEERVQAEDPWSRSASGSAAEARAADRARHSVVGSLPGPGVPPRPVLPKSHSSERDLEFTEGTFNLSGDWLLTLPAGFEHQVVLTGLGRNQYRLTPPRLNMSGVYELRGSGLHLVEPNDPRMTGFQWKAQDQDSLLLHEEPPAGKTGAKYTGATLKRLVGASLSRNTEDLPLSR